MFVKLIVVTLSLYVPYVFIICVKYCIVNVKERVKIRSRVGYGVQYLMSNILQ